ncbi:hypothetical protein NVP1031O_046 [Vibrio phage 1.031.O._10N.261.46.F8]|nr:hypothetical protein NVP1031O_046 [Vibrio phage 1.031.O._10N.261.46.F8]
MITHTINDLIHWSANVDGASRSADIMRLHGLLKRDHPNCMLISHSIMPSGDVTFMSAYLIPADRLAELKAEASGEVTVR